MARTGSLSDFGLAPEGSDARRRVKRRAEYAREHDRAVSDDIVDDDDSVELPSERSPALLFGIGVGLGVLSLAAGAVLYFGGILGAPRLGPTEPVSTIAGVQPLNEALSARALMRARYANAVLSMRSSAPASVAPELSVDPAGSAGDTPGGRTETPFPALPEPPDRGVPPGSRGVPADPLEADPVPRGGVMDEAPPRRPVPKPSPARPTAPAETAPPGETAPPSDAPPAGTPPSDTAPSDRSPPVGTAPPAVAPENPY